MSTRLNNLVRALPAGRVLIAFIAVFAVLIAFQPVALAKGDNPKPPKAPKSSIVISDNFNGTGTLATHTPRTDVVGGGWLPVQGDWQVAKGRAFDTLGYSVPYTTTINPSVSNYSVAIDMMWLGGSEAGLVFRYEDDANYYSAVYTGKQLELRKTINGVTKTLKKKKIKWKRFETKTIEVTVDGPNIVMVVDNKKLKKTDPDLEFSRSTGAIVQRTQNDEFKNFEVRALGGPITPPPITLPAIGDSVVFDSFDGTSTLPSHAPDKAPLDSEWVSRDGVWSVFGGSATETTGSNHGDLRATIDAETVDTDIYTDLTWTGGAAGVVYRYVDESNWWMTWTDGFTLLTGTLSSVHGFRLWDAIPFEWGTPGTTHRLRIRVNGHGIRVYADDADIQKVTIVSDLHEGATEVGLFSRGSVDNRFANFIVALSPDLPLPDVLPPVVPPTEPPHGIAPATPPGLTIFDSFSDFPRVWNGVHEPDLSPEFRGWKVNGGGWLADFEQLTEVTGSQSDQRVIIESGVEDSLISAKLAWRSGRAGIAFRYRDEKNWAMAWYDGFGTLAVAKVVRGGFEVMGEFPLDPKPGKFFDITVWVTDDTANVRVDKTFLGSFDVSDLPNSTIVGMFSRNVESARFDNLTLSAPATQPNFGGLSFTPVVIDTFSTAGPISLDDPLHSPDLQPTPSGWTEFPGDWLIDGGSAHETTGFDVDNRAVVPATAGDQLVSADVEYHGGRVGLTYRYRDNSNWYMYWYDGTHLVFGKVVNNGFTLLALRPFSWEPDGTVRNLAVLVVDDVMTGFIDGVDLMSISGESELSGESNAGMFTRFAPPATTFDNFEVHSVSP